MLYAIMLYDDILYNTIVLYVLQFIIYNEYIMKRFKGMEDPCGFCRMGPSTLSILEKQPTKLR